MTPPHPVPKSTHQRISECIHQGLADAAAIASAVGLTPSAVCIALAKMQALGYVTRGGTKSHPGKGRPVALWVPVAGAVVPVGSGGHATSVPLRAEVYVGRVVTSLRAGPMTRKALEDATGMGSSQLQDVLTHLVSEGSITKESVPTRGRPAFRYTLVSEPVDAASVSIRRYRHAHTGRAKADDEAHEFEGTSGVFTFGMESSPAETDCPTLGRVVLAACIDGYVTDTARRKGPCDSCAIGRARRAAWAGADFEDELEADDSDSLDLR